MIDDKLHPLSPWRALNGSYVASVDWQFAAPNNHPINKKPATTSELKDRLSNTKSKYVINARKKEGKPLSSFI